MKTLKILLLSSLLIATSCKKTETKPSEPAPVTQTPVAPTYPSLNVAFFVDADAYEYSHPLLTPVNSLKITNTFTALGAQNVCTAPGTKLAIKYRSGANDSTQCSYYFYKNNSFVGSCSFIVYSNGKLKLAFQNPFTTYMDTTCTTKTIVFN